MSKARNNPNKRKLRQQEVRKRVLERREEIRAEAEDEVEVPPGLLGGSEQHQWVLRRRSYLGISIHTSVD